MTEVIQYLIPTGSMRLDEGKLLIGQLTGPVKDIVRNTFNWRGLLKCLFAGIVTLR